MLFTCYIVVSLRAKNTFICHVHFVENTILLCNQNEGVFVCNGLTLHCVPPLHKVFHILIWLIFTSVYTELLQFVK